MKVKYVLTPETSDENEQIINFLENKRINTQKE